METKKIQLIADYALLTEENFLLAAQIEKSFEEIMNRLVGKLLNRISEKLSDEFGRGWEIETNFEDNVFDRNWYYSVYRKKWKYNEESCYWFGFAPDRTSLGDFHFYATRNTKIMKKPLDVIYHALNEQYIKGRRGEVADWWQYLDKDFRNWTHNETLVKLYRQEEMVSHFSEQFMRMKDIIEPIVEAEIKKLKLK